MCSQKQCIFFFCKQKAEKNIFLLALLAGKSSNSCIYKLTVMANYQPKMIKNYQRRESVMDFWHICIKSGNDKASNKTIYMTPLSWMAGQGQNSTVLRINKPRDWPTVNESCVCKKRIEYRDGCFRKERVSVPCHHWYMESMRRCQDGKGLYRASLFIRCFLVICTSQEQTVGYLFQNDTQLFWFFMIFSAVGTFSQERYTKRRVQIKHQKLLRL